MVEPQRHSGNETRNHAKRFLAPPPPACVDAVLGCLGRALNAGGLGMLRRR